MSAKLIVVTGANRGIGRAICETILGHPAASSCQLYATSRAGSNLDLRKQTSNQQVVYKSLDITKASSITALVDEIKQKGEYVDVLINNAGVNLDDKFSAENARTTLDINYRGTLNTCQAFLPLLRENGRIVNLSSVGSSLKPFSSELQNRFRSIASLDELDTLMQEYQQAVDAGKDADAGYPTQRSYSVSKAAINAATNVLAKENSTLTINSCCPGWVNTDMGNQVGRPPKTPSDGAVIPVKLALGDVDGISGRYWANDSIRSREDGKPQEW